MTQIVGVITREYALLAADRRLTYADGPRAGQIYRNDRCKLVSLCNVTGIGFSGLAEIERQPTHEWIARTLAEEKCQLIRHATEVLATKLPSHISQFSPAARRLAILFAGWARFDGVMRSCMCVLTNAMTTKGEWQATAQDQFTRFIWALPGEQPFQLRVIGYPLRRDRVKDFERNLQRVAAREIGPHEALRLLAAEIRATSTPMGPVGEDVLACCIPRASVENQLRTHRSLLLAALPNERVASFTLFDPSRNELRQYGPAVVCGDFAATDIVTTSDSTGDSQSVEYRLLSVGPGIQPGLVVRTRIDPQ